MMTTASRNGAGYVVNGRKSYITNADVADVLGFVARAKEASALCSWRKGRRDMRLLGESRVRDSDPSR